MSTCSKPNDDKLLSKKVYLPPKREGIQKTVIFDLDETLIHCNDDPDMSCDVKVPIKFAGGDVVQAGIIIRPFAREILEKLSKHYEIVIFTASHACYANIVLNLLDPENKYISYRLFREHCIKTKEGIFIKDLRIFSNRNLKDLFIVDNAFYSYGY
jgi:CTD small phosphatase-like protein 2